MSTTERCDEIVRLIDEVLKTCDPHGGGGDDRPSPQTGQERA
jgi:hypothetical protein